MMSPLRGLTYTMNIDPAKIPPLTASFQIDRHSEKVNAAQVMEQQQQNAYGKAKQEEREQALLP